MKNRKRIRILRIQSRICIGGPAIHTESLSLHLPKDKYETLVVGGAVENHEKSSHQRLIENDINVEIIHTMKRNILFINDFISVFKIYRLIKKFNPDIVETHTAKAGAIGRIAAFIARVPIVIHTFHGHVFHNYFSRVITKIFIIIEKVLSVVTHKIIVLSERQYNDIVHEYKIAPENKVIVIPLGIDLERFLSIEKSDNIKHELDLNRDDILIASVGRLVSVKNIRMLIDVVKKLHNKDHRYHLCLIGDGEERTELELMSDSEYIHFLGWRTDLENIYSGVEIVALTSLNEGTPIAIIEAMASGVPVVSTNVGGVGDVVKDNETGMLVESNDVNAMCEKIELLMKEPAIKNKLTKRARQYVNEKFSYQRLVKDMELLYNNLLQ